MVVKKSQFRVVITVVRDLSEISRGGGGGNFKLGAGNDVAHPSNRNGIS